MIILRRGREGMGGEKRAEMGKEKDGKGKCFGCVSENSKDSSALGMIALKNSEKMSF